MKKCTVCKQEKDWSEFNKNSTKKDGLQTLCKSCMRIRFKAYYEKNREKQSRVVRERNLRIIAECREYIGNYLQQHPCVDCGNSDIRVLEFDHVRGEKRLGVATLARSGYGLNAVVKEIEKCEVRCKNCHVIVTYERLGGTWHDKFGSLV